MDSIPTTGTLHTDRVREHSASAINAWIDRQIADRVRLYTTASPEQLSARIIQLDREWSIERMLDIHISSLAFYALTRALLGSKRWLLPSLIMMGFLFQQAVQGWCPPVEVYRWLGFRTRQEIDREKYALKVLRGDFSQATSVWSEEARVAEALRAVSL